MKLLYTLLVLLAACSEAPQRTALLLTTGEGLADPTYANIRSALTKAGYRVEAVDIPCHGKGEAQLSCWRQMYERGKSFGPFISNLKQRNADVVVGVSRAGYLALHLAAVNEQPSQYVLISPVVDLFDLAEFSGAKPTIEHDARKLPLHGKRIFLAIGKSDTRVNTQTSIDLSARYGVQLLLTNTPGHSQPRVEGEVLKWLDQSSLPLRSRHP
jgi:alpha-beta hydrolase superfamily lysophospholipase